MSNVPTPYEILRNTMYSTIATSAPSGQPYAAPMFTVYDPARQAIYWCAARTSQHGLNIQSGSPVFIVTYDSMAPGGKGAGVYLRCKAGELTDMERKSEVHALLITKHQAPYWSLEDLEAESPIALFEATIEEAWINKDKEIEGHFVLFRESLALNELNAA